MKNDYVKGGGDPNSGGYGYGYGYSAGGGGYGYGNYGIFVREHLIPCGDQALDVGGIRRRCGYQRFPSRSGAVLDPIAS